MSRNLPGQFDGVAENSAGAPLSVIIPTLNEASFIAAPVTAVLRACPRAEVIVADGGSTDGTLNVARSAARRLGARLRVVHAHTGRGHQLAAGARVAQANLLLFLHADCVPSAKGIGDVLRFSRIAGRFACGCFRYRVDAPGVVFRVQESLVNLRPRLLRLAYGDVGLFVTREAYDNAGGYDQVPLFEDVLISARLLKRGRVYLSPHTLRVSARRYERGGFLQRTAGNLFLLLRFLRGANPEELVRKY